MRSAGALEVRIIRTNSSMSELLMSMFAAPVSMHSVSKYPSVFTCAPRARQGELTSDDTARPPPSWEKNASSHGQPTA